MFNIVGPTLVVNATKFGQRIAYNSACMADSPEMFSPTMGFSADPCCHGNDVWPRRGDLVAYRLVLFRARKDSGCYCADQLSGGAVVDTAG